MEAPSQPSKRIRKLLREAAGEAYERELSTALAELDQSFACWRQGEMNPFDLSAKIHEFHQGIARTLWSRYDEREADWTVPSAIARGVLSLDDIDADLAKWIGPHVEAMREWNKERRKSPSSEEEQP